MSDTLNKLAQTLEDRKNAEAAESYVASLYAGAPDAILKKIGEEATEVLLAGKDNNNAALIHEIADLWFHTLVLLASRGHGPDDVLEELEQRLGQSGLAEKAARRQN